MSYSVSFPGLNLNFLLNPIAFKLGPFVAHWYGIIICFGFILAYWYVIKSSKNKKINPDALTDVIIIGLITGVIGARLFYVIFYPGNFYIKNPIKILSINEGGLAIYGGIFGAILGGYVACKFKKISFLKVLDLTALGFLIGQAIGRWGNFVNQEAFGGKTDSVFRMVSEKTGNIAVHPCFLYESVWCTVGFCLLHIFSKKFKTWDGQLFLMYTSWYGLGRFFIESLRSDSLILPGTNLKISQITALVAFLLATSILFINKFKTTKQLRP